MTYGVGSGVGVSVGSGVRVGAFVGDSAGVTAAVGVLVGSSVAVGSGGGTDVAGCSCIGCGDAVAAGRVWVRVTAVAICAATSGVAVGFVSEPQAVKTKTVNTNNVERRKTTPIVNMITFDNGGAVTEATALTLRRAVLIPEDGFSP